MEEPMDITGEHITFSDSYRKDCLWLFSLPAVRIPEKLLLHRNYWRNTDFRNLSVDHLKMGLIRSGYTDLKPEDDQELMSGPSGPLSGKL